jgi:hypothetical protein
MIIQFESGSLLGGGEKKSKEGDENKEEGDENTEEGDENKEEGDENEEEGELVSNLNILNGSSSSFSITTFLVGLRIFSS